MGQRWRRGPIANPANTGNSPNVVAMLGQRRRLCASIETTLGEGSCLLGSQRLAGPF